MMVKKIMLKGRWGKREPAEQMLEERRKQF